MGEAEAGDGTKTLESKLLCEASIDNRHSNIPASFSAFTLFEVKRAWCRRTAAYVWRYEVVIFMAFSMNVYLRYPTHNRSSCT